MPPKDLSKPAVIIFLNEVYEQEKKLRACWIMKHGEGLMKAATLNREPKNYYEQDVTMHNMVGGLATITRDHAEAGHNRKKVPYRDARSIPNIKDLRRGHSIVEIGAGDAKEDPRLTRPDTDLTPDPVMRPVDSTLKNILFQPRPKFGREVYLNERAKTQPEKRYYLPECSNWDYGWRMKDSGTLHKSEYGRCWLLNRTLASRVGPQPDPHHYKVSAIPGYVKCVSY